MLQRATQGNRREVRARPSGKLRVRPRDHQAVMEAFSTLCGGSTGGRKHPPPSSTDVKALEKKIESIYHLNGDLAGLKTLYRANNGPARVREELLKLVTPRSRENIEAYISDENVRIGVRGDHEDYRTALVVASDGDNN